MAGALAADWQTDLTSDRTCRYWTVELAIAAAKGGSIGNHKGIARLDINNTVPVPSASDPAYSRYGFYGLGSFCVGLGLIHFADEGEGIGTILEAILIGGLALAVFYTGYQLPSRPLSAHGQRHALARSVAMTASFAVLALAVWLVWLIEDKHMELAFLLSFGTALGAAVGSRSSIYRVESQEQLEQTQELSKLLQINQRVLRHNLRNDLSVVLGNLDRVEAAIEDEEGRDAIRTIRTRLTSLDQMSERARDIVSIWETDATYEFDLGTVLDERIASFRQDHPDIEVTTTLPAECHIVAHPTFPTAITELLNNAAEHNPPDVDISIRAQRVTGGDVQIEILDTGVGIPKSEREPITMPEETPLSHCEGLGLWMVYWIVQQSDGSFTIEDRDSDGTRIELRLPAAPGSNRA